MSLFAFVFLTICQSSSLPYNIRELIIKDTPYLSSALISVFIFWSFGTPVWIAHAVFTGKSSLLFFGFAMLLHGIVGWGLFRNAVPMESIHDVVGAPILFWPFEFEITGRFLALYYNLSFTAVFSAFISMGWFTQEKVLNLKYFLFSAVFCLVSHFIVVTKASTDNLVELMESGGSLYTSSLIWIFLLWTFTMGSLFSASAMKRAWTFFKILVPVFVISIPGTFLLIYGATEKQIFKYGQDFSALQFLLSPDRTQYVDMPELLFRFVLSFTGLICLIVLIQFPFWKWMSDKNIS